ncbi:MAG: hypothetical protein PVJ39_20340 [Gammaproteobacteria bacterium]|jgi:hypothetical protein
MNRFAKNLVLLLLLLLALSSLFSGCGSVPTDDEEAGISGTGNAINCDDPKYRKHKLCRE